ncbi:AfsR/SARP family transcriptional regulator [Planosporangium sp. 12N6]|uniref:AfsR/SARP family transcriptional regulator n=1 Tax=Planosporangium spinosum TaxID=3402278 RepID=UPI003CEA937D
MRFRLLGHIEADHDGVPVPIGRRRERCLLGLLLLEPGVAVPAERLAALLWDDEPPATARAALSTHVSRLRRVLDPAGDGSSGIRLVNRGDGYRADIDPDAVDAHRFRSMVERARALADPAERSALLREALTLWRGPLLADASDRLRARVGATLEQLRLTAMEERVDAELALGRYRPLLGELTALTAEHPLHERFTAQLMVALHQAGRPADALRVYETIRRRLADELGADPGPELRELHRRTLRGEVTAAVPPGHGEATATVPPGHRSGDRDEPGHRPSGRNDLPRDLPDFVGRQPEVAQLLASGTVATMVVSAITGMAGVGKTALAVRAAHRLAPRYPDARIFIDLHGHTADQEPTDPAAALDVLLRTWGVAPHLIPDGLAERAARWRAELAGHKVLVVLDNAASAAQVRPLLPGTAGCLAIVTSRHQLTDLDAARTLPLDVLGQADAVALFRRVVGDDRAGTGPETTAEVVGLCGYLPLAIRIAAARLRSRPAWRVDDLARRLRDEQRRLAELTAGDRSVAGAFALSYRHLTPARQRLFRLLGLHPGPDLAVPAAAALAGTGHHDTERDLEHLVDAHLLEPAAGDRYRLHDLLRAHASELVRTRDPEPDRRSAIHRVLDHYLRTAHAADLLLNPHRDPITLPDPAPGSAPGPTDPDESCGAPEQVLAWFATERPVLLAAVGLAADAGFDRHAWQLAWALATFLERRGYWHDQVATLYAALDALRRLGDRHHLAHTHRYLGNACTRIGRYDDALAHCERALALHTELGDGKGQAQTHRALAWLLGEQDRNHEKLWHAGQALEYYRSTGDVAHQADTLNLIGWTHALLGDLDRAATECRQALVLARAAGDRDAEANTLDSLGYVHHRLGRHRAAVDAYRRAADLFRRLGDRYQEGTTLTNLGDALHAAGDPTAAREAYEHALVILDDLGHPDADDVRTRHKAVSEPAGG